MAGLQGAKKNVRKYPDVGGSRHNPVGVLVRRNEAAKRDAEAAKRTPLEQLARLEARQCGHCREANDIREALKAPPVEKKVDAIAPAKQKLKAKERRANA